MERIGRLDTEGSTDYRKFCTATEENLLADISFGVVDVKKNEALEAWMELPTASPTTTLKVLYLANLCISRILN